MKKIALLGVSLASAVSCSESLPPEPLECADYRVAEVRASAELQMAEVTMEEAKLSLESASARANDEWERLREEGIRTGDIIRRSSYQEIRDDERRFETLVAQAEAQRVNAQNDHRIAVAVRLSQSCAAPKPMLLGFSAQEALSEDSAP